MNIQTSQRDNSFWTTLLETEALIGYSDADWGSDCNDCRSTTGYLFQIGGTVVTWKSQKQSCVALSTAEAEYMALSNTAQEDEMRELNSDLGNQQSQPTLIFEDNAVRYIDGQKILSFMEDRNISTSNITSLESK